MGLRTAFTAKAVIMSLMEFGICQTSSRTSLNAWLVEKSHSFLFLHSILFFNPAFSTCVCYLEFSVLVCAICHNRSCNCIICMEVKKCVWVIDLTGLLIKKAHDQK